MNILVAAPDDTIRDYLREAGYNAWSLYSNDLILQMVEKYQIEAVIYLTKVSAVIPHEEAITETRKLQIRVILAADKDKEETLLTYAAAIGVKDILIYPVNPEEIIHRLNNPATADELFYLLKNVKKDMAYCKRNDSIKEAKTNETTIYTNLNELMQKIKNTKEKLAVIDFENQTEIWGIERKVWQHDIRNGMLAVPFMYTKKTMIYLSLEKEYLKRDIRAISDLLTILKEKKIKILIFSKNNQKIKEVIKCIL
ncbi:hypothetical protein JCM39194_25360 [Desulfotomaculum varum]